MEGWIKLHRKFLGWEWYKSDHMVHLFIHLLVSANTTDCNWKGITIKRGQLVIGRNEISHITGISIQSVRTCLKRLKSTNEITIESTNQYSIITICNYDSYQSREKPSNQQTNHQTNKQLTSDQPATNHNIRIEEGKERKENKENNILRVSFDNFWNLYDKKIGSKEKIFKKWEKLSDVERDKIMTSLPEFKSRIRDKQYQPHPETYLNNRRWEDEVSSSSENPFELMLKEN